MTLVRFRFTRILFKLKEIHESAPTAWELILSCFLGTWGYVSLVETVLRYNIGYFFASIPSIFAKSQKMSKFETYLIEHFTSPATSLLSSRASKIISPPKWLWSFCHLRRSFGFHYKLKNDVNLLLLIYGTANV